MHILLSLQFPSCECIPVPCIIDHSSLFLPPYIILDFLKIGNHDFVNRPLRVAANRPFVIMRIFQILYEMRPVFYFRLFTEALSVSKAHWQVMIQLKHIDPYWLIAFRRKYYFWLCIIKHDLNSSNNTHCLMSESVSCC